MKQCVIVFDEAGANAVKHLQNKSDKFDIYALSAKGRGTVIIKPELVHDRTPMLAYETLRACCIAHVNKFEYELEDIRKQYDAVYIIEPADIFHAKILELFDKDYVKKTVEFCKDRLANTARQEIDADHFVAATVLAMLHDDKHTYMVVPTCPSDSCYNGLIELSESCQYGPFDFGILPFAFVFGEDCTGLVTQQLAKPVVKPQFKEVFSALTAMRDTTFKVANDTHRYDNKPGIADVLMHTIGEANEAHVACAANKHVKQEDVDLLLDLLEKGNDDMFKKYFKFACKSTFEDEIADLLLMVLSIAGYYNIDLATHVAMKCKYNSLRDEHSDISDYDKNH